MALCAKLITFLLFTYFAEDSTAFVTMDAYGLGDIYEDTCYQGLNRRIDHIPFVMRRMRGDGAGIASAIQDLNKNKMKVKFVELCISDTPIFIFGAYGVKGGGLFASVLDLIEYGYKKFNSVFIIDYFDTTSHASKACHQILKEIQEKAKLHDAVVKIYRFHIADDNKRSQTSRLAKIRLLEKAADEGGLLAGANGDCYPTVQSLDEITTGNVPTEILIDGIAGTQFRKYDPKSPSIQLLTILKAISCFTKVAENGNRNGATVVVNILPSGMDKDDGEWLTSDAFKFHYVLSPGWPIHALQNADAFSGVQVYWIYFRPPPTAMSGFIYNLQSLFEILNIKIQKKETIERTSHESTVMDALPVLLKQEIVDRFMLFIPHPAGGH